MNTGIKISVFFLVALALLTKYYAIPQQITVEKAKKIQTMIKAERDSVQSLFKDSLRLAAIFFQSRELYLQGVEVRKNRFYWETSQEIENSTRGFDYFTQAEKGFSIIINSQPIYSIVFYFRGLSRYQLRYYDLAFGDFNMAIKLNPKDIKSYYYRGCTNLFLKDYVNAILDFTKVINNSPNDIGALINRGSAKQFIKDYYGAYIDFSKSIEILPSKEAYASRGSLELILNKNGPAKKDFIEAIIISPRSSSYYLNLSIAYYREHKYKNALEVCKKGMLINPEDSTLIRYFEIYNKENIVSMHKK